MYRSSMRILVAPDSFKGSLGASDAAQAMVRGVLRARPDALVEACPLSDGGEGFAGVLRGAKGGVERSSDVTGPRGVTVRAAWTLLDDGVTAVIESAVAVGLELIDANERKASDTTTAGVGELIRAALDAGAKRIVVGLGGTGTTDGGAGMAQALGVVFEGAPTPATGSGLRSIRGVNVTKRDARLASVQIIAVTDVDNPLTGPEGTAHVYAPQKGATAREVDELDSALRHLAGVVEDAGHEPGDGAAGGLGYGLRVFAGATRVSGVDFVLEQTGFGAELARADLVLTGEGRLDAQTAHGKVVAGVSARCAAQHVPVVALVGAVAEGSEALYSHGLTSYFSLCNRPMSETDAMRDAPGLLEYLAENVVRTWASRPAR
jgi:glycerate kinase